MEWRKGVEEGIKGRGMGVRENERNKGKRVELGIYIHWQWMVRVEEITRKGTINSFKSGSNKLNK